MLFALLIAQLLFTQPSLSKDTTGPTIKISDSLAVHESFPGGMSALSNYLGTHISYPKKAIKKDIEGTVRVMFVVEPDGQLTNLRVVSKPLLYLDDEALRVVRSMPLWIPAKLPDGEKVAILHVLPVKFKLE